MVRVFFTQNLRRYVDCPPTDVAGATVRQVLNSVFETNPRLRGYVLDDAGSVSKHICVFVNGQ